MSKWTWPSCSPTKTHRPKHARLSDDELRQRIFANATVLFPCCSTTSTFEIVYATRPRFPTAKDADADPRSDPPWQYALLVRRLPSGDYTPLIKGVAWSTTEPWSMVLQGLLDSTAVAINQRFAGVKLPSIAAGEESLPRYESQRTGAVDVDGGGTARGRAAIVGASLGQVTSS